MTHFRSRLLSASLAAALGAAPVMRAYAEDLDLFVAASGTAATNPNVLVIIDNSANWSAANQHWPGNVKQGQSELRALKNVVGGLGDNVNLGLMLFTAGSGSNFNGSYVRYAIRQMTAVNKAAFQRLIGTDTCTTGANSLNGTANCIFNNFDGPVEKVGTAKLDYSAGLFEVFKYLGGFTSPLHAQDGIAGAPVDASHFGALRYAGNPDPNSDPAAYTTDASKSGYVSPLNASSSCAKNYLIFIGNGFPSSDSPATLLTGVQGDATQLPMPVLSSTTTTTTTTIGTDTVCHTNAQCVTAAQAAAPGLYDTYSCSGGSRTGCTGTNLINQIMSGTKTVTTVTQTSQTQLPTSSTARFADEWAKYLFTTDVSSASGQQNVTTFTIDVYKDAPDTRQSALLSSMAKYGGGTYSVATSEDQIAAALQKILIDIQAKNSVFASASLQINATNRSQNENQVFIGMFRPDGTAKPKWYGNLKRYQVALFGTAAKLADVNGNEATSATTGFLQSCATSFWTTDTTNPSPYNPAADTSYWRFSPTSSGLCLTSGTSPFSDLPDGPQVEKGAVAEVLRKGNDPAVAPTNAVNRNVLTCISPSNCSLLVAFNSINVSQAELGAATATEQQDIINFTLGQDIGDENGNNNLTEVRASIHGDVAHSRPLPVNYAGTTGVVIYYGANDGNFHAVRGSDGKELWSFIAPEHHAKLKRLKDNAPVITYPGTPPLVVSQKKDYFFDGSAGLFQNLDNTKIWIFPSMRRGGRMMYGLDVTDAASPVLKWRVGCPNPTDDTGCTTGFSGIGQTWSFPNVALIKGNSSTSPVVVVGGGYDACEDADTTTPTCTTPKGNKVFVIDADTGALIKSFDTDRSVVGDVTLIDRDFDGLVDHGYVADTGGNLYRINFVDPFSLAPLASVNWTITKIASTSLGSRKFLFAPAALAAGGRVYLTLGSGDREHPLQTNYPFVNSVMNRAYMYIDRFETTGLPVDLDGASLDDFTSSSSCTTALSGTSKGWRIDLNNGRGEQTVTSSVIFGGLVFFSTNRPDTSPTSTCGGNLGIASGYAVNLLNASGAVGTGGLCGAYRSNIFAGGGLPPSPVTGTVPIAGVPTTIMIGGVDRGGGASSSPIGAQKIKPSLSSKRSRAYWYQHEQ